MSLTLQYHVPPLGLVRTSLYREALTLYEFLSQKGEIDRLKRLDHLGVVRRASEGAHHPRWEYIMLIMHLVDLTKENVKEAHLGTRPRVASHRISSGQELLKMWAFLLHLGHLHWTFTAEKALLAEVKRSRSLRRQLLATLPNDGQVRLYARRILRREDVYRFYHVLAFVRLHGLRKDHPDAPLWIEALKAYCLRGAEIDRLAAIYHRLRQIAILVLDSHYTPAIAGLDFAEILTDPKRLNFVLDAPDSSSIALMDAIETHLYESVYLSTETMRHAAALISDLRLAISQRIRKGLHDVLDSLVKGRLQQSVDTESPSLLHTMNVPFRVGEPFTSVILPEARPLREEADWCAVLPQDLRSSVVVSVWPFPDARQETVDVFATQRKGRLVEAVLAAVLKRLARLYEDDRKQHARLFGRNFLEGRDFLQDVLYRRVAVSFLLNTLRQIFKTPARWEFRGVEGSPSHQAILATSRREARAFLSRELRTLSRLASPEATARKRELQAVQAALRAERAGCFVLGLARLLAYNAEGVNIGELDGLWVALSYGRVRVMLVEAKDHRKKASAMVRRQLELTFNRLGLWEDCKYEITYRLGSQKHPHFGMARIRFDAHRE
ncbi:MAG TPA: hypothetical protein VNI83_11410 [Vicinamibacterales bacterium]|nr:hypothetical protein [Vicinamibacterales bacterium]